jgi:hypothetical protein
LGRSKAEETGIQPPSYRTLRRRLPTFAAGSLRAGLAAACARHAGLGPASLVLYDVSTLYFETDAGDGFREPGFSNERRLDPQITIGLLTNAAGFPLMVHAFEGNRAETTTMLPVIQADPCPARRTAQVVRAAHTASGSCAVRPGLHKAGHRSAGHRTCQRFRHDSAGARRVAMRGAK